MLYIRFIAALVLISPVSTVLATTHKCTDGKNITYANTPCETLGLNAIGKVRKIITIMPATSTAILSVAGQEEDDQNASRHDVAQQSQDDASLPAAKSTGQQIR